MEHAPEIINLQKYIISGITAFNSRSWGMKVRIESNLDNLVKEDRKVVIRIPENVDTINTPFLEELLRNVLYKFNYDLQMLKSKVSFENEGNYKIDYYLNEAVQRIANTEAEYA